MSTREKSSKQEKFISGYLGAYTTPNSGAGAFKKGDLQDEISMIEAKTSMSPKKSYSVKKADVDTLRRQAFEAGKELAVLAFDFGVPTEKDTYIVMNIRDYKKLYDYYRRDMNGETD